MWRAEAAGRLQLHVSYIRATPRQCSDVRNGSASGPDEFSLPPPSPSRGGAGSEYPGPGSSGFKDKFLSWRDQIDGTDDWQTDTRTDRKTNTEKRRRKEGKKGRKEGGRRRQRRTE